MKISKLILLIALATLTIYGSLTAAVAMQELPPVSPDKSFKIEYTVKDGSFKGKHTFVFKENKTFQHYIHRRDKRIKGPFSGSWESGPFDLVIFQDYSGNTGRTFTGYLYPGITGHIEVDVPVGNMSVTKIHSTGQCSYKERL